MGTLFFYILQTLVLLDHVYSDCLQNVATNTKNKPFSGFGPWPRSNYAHSKDKFIEVESINQRTIVKQNTFMVAK